MSGLLFLNKVMCVSVDKRDLGDGGYYYELCFTTGKELVSMTAGKVGDGLEFGKWYNLGLNYRDKKLKLADYELIK